MTEPVPFNRARCRSVYADVVRKHMITDNMIVEVRRIMLSTFMSLLDMEVIAPRMDFTDSYTTLHDHELGAEIMKQIPIERQFLAFCGDGKFMQLFGGEDELIGGSMMTRFADRFASAMDASFKAREYRPELIRLLSRAFKSTDWWTDNHDFVSRTLHRNRKRLNAVKSVQES